jgi:hypothetical protein
MHISTTAKNYQQRLEFLRPLLNKERELFNDYVKKFLTGRTEQDYLYLLKQEHSQHVLSHALDIAANEKIFHPAHLKNSVADADRILLLSALYHDIGRFMQLKRYNTFNDAQSVNHARLGAKLLYDTGFLTEESPQNRAYIRLAVLMHNRYALPEHLHKAVQPICQALRDADKLDIIRILCAEFAPGHTPDPTVALDLEDSPKVYGKHCVETILQHRQIMYNDMHYINDFKLLLCSLFYSLVFDTSRTILARSGLLEQILAGLPQDRKIEKMSKKMLQSLKKSK